LGYGSRSDFTKNKQARSNPGSIYNNHIQNSIETRVKTHSVGKNDSFGNQHSKYEGTCYKGQERFYYGKTSLGPGAYMQTDSLNTLNKTSSRFAPPKSDRGLLVLNKNSKPGPGNYDNISTFSKTVRTSERCSMGRASRDIPFQKYTAQNKDIVSKGLF